MLAEKRIGFRLKHLLKFIFSFFALFFFSPEEGVEMQNSIVQFRGGVSRFLFLVFELTPNSELFVCFFFLTKR